MKALQQNKKDAHFQNTQMDIIRPADKGLEMSIGRITEVNEENRVVRVKDFKTGEVIGEEPDGSWLRILNSWEDIVQRFGNIEEGFWVKIWQRGSIISRDPIIEVIGDDTVNFSQSTPRNKGKMGVFKILSPGI
jgi:hypothetical protein